MKFRSLLILMLAVFALVGVIPLAAQSDADAAFPVTVTHKFGSTTITKAPERVVAIGFTDQDPLLALGVTPVAVRYWYGDESDGIFPWGDELAGDAQPVVLNMAFGSLNYEAILALKPDLISAVYSGITQEEYDTLSQIAPTIAQSADYIDFGIPWQETTRLIGAALGKSAEADQLVTDAEAKLVAAREENPQFAGKNVVVAYAYKPGSYGFYTSQDPRGRFFTDLGFTIPDDLVQLAGDSFYADIDAERIDLLDRDLLVVVGLQFVEGGREGIEADPLLSQLKVVKEGRVLFVPGDVDDALQFNTVLSLPFLIDGVLPALQAAVDGAASTDASAGQAAAECDPGFRLFANPLLTTDPVCIPEDPQRVAFLIYASYLYPFGVKPVGAWGMERDAANFPMIADWITDGFTDIGMPPSLETLTQLAPDLMIFPDTRIGEAGEELPLIAPTILYDEHTNWRDRHLMLGDIFGQLDESKAQLAVVDQRLAELKAAITETRGDTSDTTVSVIRIFEPGNYFLANERYIAVEFLKELGFKIPEAVQNLGEDEWGVSLSDEQINLANADVIILLGSTGGANNQAVEGDAMVAQLMEDPLWNTLDAFQQKQVFTVKDNFQQSSLLAAHIIIDELTRIFDVQIATPNPYLAATAGS